MAERARRVVAVAARVAIGALIVGGVGALAHLPLGAAPTDAALRVVLRTQQARIEICRERTADELARLPAHMRQARDCRETAVDYRLRVAIDGRTLIDRVVAHRGVRRNRPLFLDERMRVAPGRRRVEIEFAPIAGGDLGDAARDLPRYRTDREITFEVGRIVVESPSP